MKGVLAAIRVPDDDIHPAGGHWWWWLIAAVVLAMLVLAIVTMFERYPAVESQRTSKRRRGITPTTG